MSFKSSHSPQRVVGQEYRSLVGEKARRTDGGGGGGGGQKDTIGTDAMMTNSAKALSLYVWGRVTGHVPVGWGTVIHNKGILSQNKWGRGRGAQGMVEADVNRAGIG